MYRLFLIIIFIFYQSLAKSDTLLSLDLVPIEDLNTLIYFDTKTSIQNNNDIIKLTNNFNEFKLDNLISKHISYYKQLNNFDFLLGLEESKIRKKSLNSSRVEYLPKNINLSILGKKYKIFGFEPFIGVNYDETSNIHYDCLSNSYIMVGSNFEHCKTDSKVFYRSSPTEDIPSVISKGSIVSINSGLRKKYLDWNSKTILHYGFKINSYDFDNDFSRGFLENLETHKIFFPQDNKWYDYVIELSLRNSKTITQNFGIGFGLTGFILKDKNYSKRTNIVGKRNNLKIDFKASYKLMDNIYLNWGGLISKNSILGYKPLLKNQIMSSTQNHSYIETSLSVTLNIGKNEKTSPVLSNEKLNIQNLDFALNKNKKYSKENRDYQDNIISNKKTKKKVNISYSDDLKIYAINFSKLHDMKSDKQSFFEIFENKYNAK